MTKTEHKRREILTGNLWKVIISITFPLFCYEIFNSLYSLIDQVMVSNISSLAVSAVASTQQIRNLFSAFSSGLAAGGAIVIARKYGAGEVEDCKKDANNMFMIGLVMILILLCLMPFSSEILRICGTPEELISIASTYFMFQLLEQAIIVVNNIFVGTEKSKGNTKLVFKANMALMIIKLILNAILIYVVKITDLEYVEIATICGQLVLFTIAVTTLFNKTNIFRIEPSYLKPDFKRIGHIIKMSFPLFLGKFVISFGKVGVNALCKNYGAYAVGALGVSNNITGLITSGSSTFEDSESSIVSQNLGNKNMKRTLKVFRICMTLCLIWGTVGYICVRFLFQDQIINLFNNTNDAEEFILTIKQVFKYASLTIPALAINSAVLGLLYGYGQTFLSTVNNILRIAIRIGSLLYFETFMPEMGVEAVGWSMALSNVAIGIMALIFLTIFMIKTHKQGYKDMTYNDPEPEMIEVDGVLMNKALLNN